MRAALVTGGSRGIGLALAQALGREGYAVTLAARDADALSAAVAGLTAAGGEACAVAVDLAGEDGPPEALRAHQERWGRLDMLVNNVGAGFGQPVGEISTRRLELQLALNLRAAISLQQEAAELLLAAGAEHRRAWVVNVCSRAAVVPQPWLSVYSATKAALLGFSAAVNRELAPRGVRSCAICPGTVATDLASHAAAGGEDLVTLDDVAEVLHLLLLLSPACRLTQVVLESGFDLEWQPPA